MQWARSILVGALDAIEVCDMRHCHATTPLILWLYHRDIQHSWLSVPCDVCSDGCVEESYFVKEGELDICPKCYEKDKDKYSGAEHQKGGEAWVEEPAAPVAKVGKKTKNQPPKKKNQPPKKKQKQWWNLKVDTLGSLLQCPIFLRFFSDSIRFPQKIFEFNKHAARRSTQKEVLEQHCKHSKLSIA